MPLTWICKTSRRFLSLLALCMAAQQALAGSPSYHQSVSVGQDGKPSLQLTNDSEVPITAFIMVEFPSLGMEGRTYSDVYVSPQDGVIPPKASITRGLSLFRGSDARKVRAEVRAVIFKDGSTAGDPVWVNALLARRVRLYDRTLSLHDLLSPLVAKGTSLEAVLDILRAAQADAEKHLPDDDLRVMDTVAFYGAISTLDKNREAPVDVVLKVYLQYLEKRALLLEFSRPDLDHIRTLPVTTPEPLSDASLPADFQAAAARASRAAVNAATLPSSCSIAVPDGVKAPPTASLTCTDSDGDEVVQNNVYTFEVKFVQYSASTKADSDVTWSSPANQGPFNTVGVCVQYNDCDDSPEVYYIEGVADGVGCAAASTLPGNCEVEQGQNPASFYWLLDRYPYPTFSDCDECDTDPGGYENPVSTNAQVPSTKWSFNYACTVSP